ncbi:MAG: ROK family protein [Bacteroidales bacterium]
MQEISVGIDIGGTNTIIGLVDRKGEILAETQIGTGSYISPEEYVEAIAASIKMLLGSVKVKNIIRGIGIGAPMGNYYSGCIEQAANLRWKGIIPLVEMLRKKFDTRIVLTNDANAAAMGEMIFGAAKSMKNFIVVTLGTGLGSGFVVDGKLVYGHDGFAGELGHTIYNPEGRLCGCGRKGCLETYASATGIKTTVLELLGKSGEESTLRSIPEGELNSKNIYEAALKGDKIATEAFDITARILGLKLADSVVYTSPEAIFLFGGLALSGDVLLKPTKTYMEHYMLSIFKNKVKLELSGLMGKNAAVLGAAALIWD